MKKITLQNLAISDLWLLQHRVNQKIESLNTKLNDPAFLSSDLLKMDLLFDLFFDLRRKQEQSKNKQKNTVSLRVSVAVVLLEMLSELKTVEDRNEYEKYLFNDLSDKIYNQLVNL